MSSCSPDACPFQQLGLTAGTPDRRRDDRSRSGFSTKGKVLLLIVVLNLVAAAAGTATGTVMSGNVDASMSVAVNQALQVQKPQFAGIPADRSKMSSTSTDGTAFTAAAKSYNGESFLIIIPLVNYGEADIVVEMTIARPIECTPLDQNGPCAESMVLTGGGSGRVTEVAAVANNKWKFTVPKGSNGSAANPVDAVVIGVQIAGDAVPGFRNIRGQMITVAY